MQLWKRLAAVIVLAAAAPAMATATCPGWRNPAGTKIVGGDRAKLEQWPSVASLRLTAPDQSDALFICGGTVIAREWVMTAAHCFDHIVPQADGRLVSTDEETRGWTLDVVLGTDDLTNVTAENTFAIAVNENYQRERAPDHGEDIALVRLAEGVSRNEVPAHLCHPGWRVAFRRSRIADDEDVGAPRCGAVRRFDQLSGVPSPPHPHPSGHARGCLAYGPRVEPLR